MFHKYYFAKTQAGTYYQKAFQPIVYNVIAISVIKRNNKMCFLFFNTRSRLPNDLILRATFSPIQALHFIFFPCTMCTQQFIFFYLPEILCRSRVNGSRFNRQYFFKVEIFLKGSLDAIPSPSVKIQIMGGKVYLRCKGKTLLGVVNKLLKTKSLLTLPSHVLPYNIK